MADGKTPEQELVQRWNRKYEACKKGRQPFEREWFTNLAFYFGKQYAQWISTSITQNSSLVVPKAPAWRVRLVSNRLKPLIRKEVSKLNKERGHFFVIPSSADDEDVSKARVGDAVAEHLLFSKNFRLRKRTAVWWSSTCGTGFVKTHFTDDIEYLAVSPFHLLVPDLDEEDIQVQPYVIHECGYSEEYVEEKFGKKVEGKTTYQGSDAKYLQGLGLNRQSNEEKIVLCKEFWVKPCGEFPDGAFFVIAENELLTIEPGKPEYQIDPMTGQPIVDPETEEPMVKEEMPSNILGGGPVKSKFPYQHGDYPFARIGHILTGRFYGESLLVDLIPIQKEYNKSRSQGIESRNLTGKPQWAVSKGSVDPRKITSQPGLIIEYTPGFDPPQPVKNPELPAYSMQLEQRALDDMDFISNMYEVSQGRTPPGIEAASAIAYLQEESDSILQTTVDSIEEAVEAIGYQSLCLAKQYWSPEKLVAVVSGNQVYEVFQFEQSLPDEIDFRVEHGSMAPRSRAAKQAFILEIIEKGYIPPLDGLRYLEMSETSRLYEELQIDARHAQREDFKMSKGLPVGINIFDNHQVHVFTHGKYLKGQKFEALPDEIKQQMLMHYQEHLMQIGQIEVNGNVDVGNGTGESGSGAESRNGEQQPAY